MVCDRVQPLALVGRERDACRSLVGEPFFVTLLHRQPDGHERLVGMERVEFSVAMVARQPFGGHKLSGSGAKTGGPGYLEQFSVPVVVTENTQRQGFAPDL